mmetsp:Transcript_16953/g.37011  ORF Transcript_16953/g.37011 Transcript_16953/m.37011 type:complete len:343 (-) Transcript_16953:203-1231(-)
MSLVQCHGCEGNPIRHVAHGVDSLHIGLGILVDRNKGSFRLHSGRFEVQTIHLALTARGHEYGVRVDALTIFRHHGQGAVGVFDNFGRVGVELDIDAAVVDHFIAQHFSYVLIKPSQEQVATIHECHVAAHAIHDLGKFQGNETSTHHDNAFGLFWEVKDFIAGNGMLDTGNGWLVGPSSRGHDGIFGFERSNHIAAGGILDHDGTLAVQGSKALHHFHAHRSEHKLLIDTVESTNLLILGRHKILPTKGAGSGTGPSVPSHFGNHAGVPGGKYHELFGNATHIDAGSSNGTVIGRPMFQLRFDNGHFFAVRRRDAGGSNAAGTAANHNQVVFFIVIIVGRQ